MFIAWISWSTVRVIFPISLLWTLFTNIIIPMSLYMRFGKNGARKQKPILCKICVWWRVLLYSELLFTYIYDLDGQKESHAIKFYHYIKLKINFQMLFFASWKMYYITTDYAILFVMQFTVTFQKKIELLERTIIWLHFDCIILKATPQYYIFWLYLWKYVKYLHTLILIPNVK